MVSGAYDAYKWYADCQANMKDHKPCIEDRQQAQFEQLTSQINALSQQITAENAHISDEIGAVSNRVRKEQLNDAYRSLGPDLTDMVIVSAKVNDYQNCLAALNTTSHNQMPGGNGQVATCTLTLANGNPELDPATNQPKQFPMASTDDFAKGPQERLYDATVKASWGSPNAPTDKAAVYGAFSNKGQKIAQAMAGSSQNEGSGLLPISFHYTIESGYLQDSNEKVAPDGIAPAYVSGDTVNQINRFNNYFVGLQTNYWVGVETAMQMVQSGWTPPAAADGSAAGDGAPGFGAHPIVLYTIKRFLLLVVVGAVLYLVGIRGVWLILFSFLVSGFIAMIALRGSREVRAPVFASVMTTVAAFLPIAVRYDGSAPAGGHGYQVHVGPMYSDARGTLRIRSANPHDKPSMTFNYLSTDQDRREWVEAIRVARDILTQPAFEPFNAGEISPGPGVETDEEILDWVRHDAETALHPSCTARMGVDGESVLDPLTMRVHGVEGLRVVDASIMPTLVAGSAALFRSWSHRHPRRHQLGLVHPRRGRHGSRKRDRPRARPARARRAHVERRGARRRRRGLWRCFAAVRFLPSSRSGLCWHGRCRPRIS